MGTMLLNAIWIGSFKATRLEAEQLHAKVLLAAEESKIGDLVSNVASTKGVVQFMIMPSGSKEGWPENDAWEDLVALSAKWCAGTHFIIKRLYVGET